MVITAMEKIKQGRGTKMIERIMVEEILDRMNREHLSDKVTFQQSMK